MNIKEGISKEIPFIVCVCVYSNTSYFAPLTFLVTVKNIMAPMACMAAIPQKATA